MYDVKALQIVIQRLAQHLQTIQAVMMSLTSNRKELCKWKPWKLLQAMWSLVAMGNLAAMWQGLQLQQCKLNLNHAIQLNSAKLHSIGFDQ